jgi:hypothetical protein
MLNQSQPAVIVAVASPVSLQCLNPSTQEALSLSQNLQFQHRHKTFELKLTDDGAIELYLDNCLRKRRDRGAQEPQYVWTNVELEWEEHHYIEARYWASTGQLKVTVNGDPLLDTEMRLVG